MSVGPVICRTVFAFMHIFRSNFVTPNGVPRVGIRGVLDD